MKPEDKIVTYMLLTALMVVTFFCALAINTGTYSSQAWIVLLAMNLCLLYYTMTRP